MPTVRILGQEVERKHLFIGGGLLAAAVAVIVWLRSRAAASAPDEAQPGQQPDQSQGYGMSVAAPSGQVADQYQQQLDNSQLQAQNIANRYQENLVTQQQKQFEFQQSQMEALAPAYQEEERTALAVRSHYNEAAAKAKVSCPGSASLRTGPDGQLYCRQKTSGGFLGIPVGDIFRTVQNFVGGVEAAAPNIGYQAAQDAASYYTGKLFSPDRATQKVQHPRAQPAQTETFQYQRSAPPTTGGPAIAPSVAPHGYGDIA